MTVDGVRAIATRVAVGRPRADARGRVGRARGCGRGCGVMRARARVVFASGEGAGEAEEEDGGRRWKPKPLPSTFGNADASARTRSPFENAAGGVTGGAVKPASPFGAPAAGGDKPAGESPFGAAEARSPFAAAPGSAAAKSPFGGASAAKNPFNEPEAALYGAAPAKKKAQPAVEEEKKSLLESLPRPTLGQVVIVLSFTTIISLMLGTFWVVVNAGGVHFND